MIIIKLAMLSMAVAVNASKRAAAGGSGGASTAGSPIGLLLLLTKAS